MFGGFLSVACLVEQVKRQVEGIGGLLFPATHVQRPRLIGTHPKKYMKFRIKSRLLSLLSPCPGRGREGRGHRVFLGVQAVFLDIRHYWRGQEISHGQPSLQKEPDLGGRDVILNQLGDHVNVVSPPC